MSATDELRAAMFLTAKRYMSRSEEVVPLDTALEIVSRLEQENARLKQFVTDTTEGMECLPTCDSTAHAELCPVANPVEAWRVLRRENAELTKQMNHTVCTYCGALGPKPEPWSREAWVEIIQAHLAECPTHPANMYLKAMRENAELRRDIEQGFMEGAYARLKNLQDAERENAELKRKLAAALDPTWSPEPVKGEGE